MTAGATRFAWLLDRAKLMRAADMLAVAAAISLPWSTSASSILIAIWIIVLLPALDLRSLRAAVATPAGLLPAALVAFAVVGMLWASSAWIDRFAALNGFLKLATIPLLIAQFRNSEKGLWVAGGFAASCTVLLVLSYLTYRWPALLWRSGSLPGVPGKDYIVQSAEFLLCAFGLGHAAISACRCGRKRVAAALGVLAFLFLANIVYIETGRTTLVVAPFLLVIVAVQRFHWKGVAAVLLCGVVVAGAGWLSSAGLRWRVFDLANQIRVYETNHLATSAGYRLVYWKKSLEFISTAPVIGHGTGSIESLFKAAAEGHTGVASAVTENPHNQTLMIAVQLGLLGTALLFAMWIAHLLLFRGPGLAAWIGLGAVVQNIIGSLFNSHLFDFTPGWIYVFAIGVLGAMALREPRADSATPP